MNAETRGQRCNELDLEFSRKSVHYWWELVTRDAWKLHETDTLASARKFISENGHIHHVALLDVSNAPGTRVLAFEITDFIEEWGPHTQELGMDSTCTFSHFNTEF